MNVKKRIDKFLLGTKHSLSIAKTFGIKQGLLEWGDTVFFRSRGKIGKQCSCALHENVKKYLIKNYMPILNLEMSNKGNQLTEDAPIWVFWWQGLEQAPNIVHKCITSIKNNSIQHPVIIIDKNNYKKYTNIPTFVIDKLEQRIISFTHFSDILRLDLLYQNGGIWMDATLLATENFTSYIKGSFFTVRHGLFADSHVCKGLWSTFLIAAGKNSTTIKVFRDLFYEYLRNEKEIITYFLIDCIIAVCYDNIPQIKKEIDSVPINNTHIFELLPLLNHQYDELLYHEITENTQLFKLSYKNIPDSFYEKTFYDKIVNRVGGSD